MTIDQAIARINQIERDLLDQQEYFELAKFITSETSDRIFVKGQDTSGGDIGTYSSKPLYVNPDVAPRSFARKGKTGETKFKNGKSHKTGYFNGYGQYKQQIGEGNRVNLRLFRNFEVAYNAGGEFSIESGRLVYKHTILTSAANPVGKIEGIKDKYPNAFGLSQQEKQIVKDNMTDIIKNILLNKK